MNGPVDLSVYKETLLFLVTAGVVAPLFIRLRVSPVLGFLLAGAAPEPAGEPHPALDLLASIKPDELSPKEALELLYKLKTL